MGLDIKIQSLKPSSFLEARVEAFLTSFHAVLAGFSLDKVENEKTALSARLREKPKNLSEETTQFWMAIVSGYEDFLRSRSTCYV